MHPSARLRRLAGVSFARKPPNGAYAPKAHQSISLIPGPYQPGCRHLVVTLDADTCAELDQRAQAEGLSVNTLAGQLLRRGMAAPPLAPAPAPAAPARVQKLVAAAIALAVWTVVVGIAVHMAGG